MFQLGMLALCPSDEETAFARPRNKMLDLASNKGDDPTTHVMDVVRRMMHGAQRKIYPVCQY